MSKEEYTAIDVLETIVADGFLSETNAHRAQRIIANKATEEGELPYGYVYECVQPGTDGKGWCEFFGRDPVEPKSGVRNIKALYERASSQVASQPQASDECSTEQYLKNVSADVVLALRNTGRDSLAELLEGAVRQVDNKAEVEPMCDFELKRLRRLLEVAGVGAVDELDGDTAMACFWALIGSITNKLEATPPATTGASTAPHEIAKALGLYEPVSMLCAVKAIESLRTPVAAQAGQVAVAGWISTDDRLPDNGKDVIILYWPYDNHENERVAGTAHHVEGTFYDEDGNDMHPPSHWMPFVIPEATPSPAKESK